MQQQLTVSPQRLMERSAQCSSRASEMQETIQAMTALMNEISTEWLGTASESFQNQYAELLPGFNNMHDLVTKLAGQLNQIGRNYEELENTTAGQLGAR